VSRFVLLGASNARRGFPTIVHAARRTLPGPMRILAAIGHGRSYGLRSSVLGRGLPSILGCGLWDSLGSPDDSPTLAVVTDVGNDILYGAEVPEILSWVSTCLEYLARVNARIVVTGLPMENLRRLDQVRFSLFRTVLFPGSRLKLEEVKLRAEELDVGLAKLSKHSNAELAKPRPEWYGLDPIHIRFRQIPDAWASILGIPAAPISTAHRFDIGLRVAAPQRRTIFGVEQSRRQPARVLPDGSTVSLY
jgi:hypothetical protein